LDAAGGWDRQRGLAPTEILAQGGPCDPPRQHRHGDRCACRAAHARPWRGVTLAVTRTTVSLGKAKLAEAVSQPSSTPEVAPRRNAIHLLAYTAAIGLAAVAAWFSIKGMVVLFPRHANGRGGDGDRDGDG